MGCELEAGDILLFRGTDMVNRLIQFFSHSPYSHAALYLGKLYGEPLLAEAEIRGVWINTLRAKQSEIERIDVYRVKAPEDYRHKTPLAVFPYISDNYGFAEILGFLVAYATGLRVNPFKNAEQFVCSELVDTAYLGLFSQERSTKQLISPGDIAKSSYVDSLGPLQTMIGEAAWS